MSQLRKITAFITVKNSFMFVGAVVILVGAYVLLTNFYGGEKYYQAVVNDETIFLSDINNEKEVQASQKTEESVPIDVKDESTSTSTQTPQQKIEPQQATQGAINGTQPWPSLVASPSSISLGGSNGNVGYIRVTLSNGGNFTMPGIAGLPSFIYAGSFGNGPGAPQSNSYEFEVRLLANDQSGSGTYMLQSTEGYYSVPITVSWLPY